MAKKPQPVVDDHSESSEEDESSSEQESDPEPALTQITKKPSSSTPAAAKKPKSQSVSKPHHKPPVEEESESESESESETESESDSDGPDPKLSSIATQSKDDPRKSNNGAKKSKSKPSAASLVTPTKPAGLKRPAQEMATGSENVKKSKKKKADPEISDAKPTSEPAGLFRRIWSDDDEIAILRGMIDYWAKNNTDPIADLTAFHDFVKENLHIVATNAQLLDKIRRLKKKYENIKSKEKKVGKLKSFSKPHEQNAYELSKSVWDRENVKEKRLEKVVRKAVAVDTECVEKVVGKAVAGDIELSEGDTEWNKLMIDEMDSYLRHMEVKTAQARFVYQRLKPKKK